MTVNIAETLWFTGMYGFCGVVLGEDPITGERKAYLGVHAGRDEGMDRKMIVGGGAKINKGHAKRILDHLEGK